MQKKRKLWTAVALICVLAAVVCAGIVIRHYLLLKKDAGNYEKLLEEAKSTEGVSDEETAESEAADDTTEYVDIPIDFDTLQEQNADIYAWITVPGTLVDYPVLQSATADTFYLTHGVDGEESAYGCIYTESANAKDFTDPQTVLYGHNMRDDSMFGSLHEFEDRTFFDEYRYIYVYTPTEKLTYEIFAAYPWSNEHLLNCYDTNDPQAFAAYLDTVKSVRGMNAFVQESVAVDENDCIITLSTCIGNDSKRYLVQGVLISREAGKRRVEEE